MYATFDQPANSTGLVILTHKASGGDADLYVSSATSTPDDSNYTFRSWASGDDAIRLPLTTTQRRWYVGVHSYTGSAHAILDVKFQKSSASIPITVYTEWPPNGSEQTQIAQFLKSGALRMISATDGAMILGPFDVHNHPGCTYNRMAGVCLNQSPYFASWSWVANDCKSANAVFFMPIWQNNWNLYFVHEMGHGCFGLADEYSPVTFDELCGHSQMNSSCSALVSTATAGYCSRRHCLDGASYDGTVCNSSTISNWAWLKQQTSIPLTWAGDWASAHIDPRRTNYTNNAVLAGMVQVNFH